MKLKHLITLFVIFGLLAASAVVKKVMRERQAQEASRKSSAVFLTRGLDADFIGSIILYKGDATDKKIVLSRRTDSWVLASRNNIPAKKDQVDRLIQDLQDIQGEPRGVSSDVFADFQIADDQGLHVIVQSDAGQDITHLVFGTKMPHPGASFCRLAGSQETLLVESNLPRDMGISDAESKLEDRPFVVWRIYSDKVKEAVRIDVTNPKEPAFSVIKAADGAWQFEPAGRRGEAVDKEKVDGFLKIFSEVEGRELVEPQEGTDYGFGAPQVRVAVTVAGEKEEASRVFDIQVGSKVPVNAGMYFVKALPQNVIYQVPENAAGNLIVTRSSFQALRKK